MRRRLHVLLLGQVAWTAAIIAAQQPAPAGTNPVSGNPAAIAAGRTLFAQLCQTCHGPGAEGGGDRGPALNGGTFAHGGADPDLFRTIRSGVRGTQMPPFAGLSDPQI